MLSDDATEVLAQVPMLARLKRRELKRLAGRMHERTFPAGSHAMVEGEGGLGFFIVVDGAADVSVGDAVVNTLGPGEWFGEMALLGEGKRTATVTATSDLRCLGMTVWEFKPFLADNPEAAWEILSTMAARAANAPAGS